MIQIAVCDDEPVMCRILKEKLAFLLKSYKESCSITSYISSAELLNTTIAFDLIFLDIQLPGFDGIETARQLRERMPDCTLIFVTILKDCMSKAFELEAFDYLIKPIDEERFVSTLDRALKRLCRRREPHLLIRSMNQYRSIALSSVFYCEVINRKLYLHTQEGIIDYYGKMEEIEKQLDNRFFRCHRSYLVNLDYFKSYSEGQLFLKDGSTVPVSRLRHREFMETMLQHMSL